MRADLVIKGARVVTENAVERLGVVVRHGKIAALCNEDMLPEADEVIDAGGKHLLPGSVDSHTHFRDPSEPTRETFKTGTMAAAWGGVTTVCEHPISLPSVYRPDILRRREQVAGAQSLVDFAFFGAAGSDQLPEIAAMGKEPIIAFKTFFHAPPAGRDREFVGLTMKNDAEILAGFREVAKTGKMLAVHAENNDILNSEIARFRKEGKVAPEYHALSRPPFVEYESVAKVLYYARETGLRVELCHISTAEACRLAKEAKRMGQQVYLETCPQYLFLNTEDLKKHGTWARCNPPIRDQQEVDGLWEYVNDGTVDFVGSDHSPFLAEEKASATDDIFAAPCGFPGVDVRVPLMLTAVKNGRLSLLRAVHLLARGPAQAYGLFPQKGAIRVGADADLILVDMDREFTVKREELKTMAWDCMRVFDRWTLTGKPVMTMVRGRVVMRDGNVDESASGWGVMVKPANGGGVS